MTEKKPVSWLSHPVTNHIYIYGITLILFSSWPFSIVTPLPLVYAFLRYRQQSLLTVALPLFGFAVVFQWWLTRPETGFIFLPDALLHLFVAFNLIVFLILIIIAYDIYQFSVCKGSEILKEVLLKAGVFTLTILIFYQAFSRFYDIDATQQLIPFLLEQVKSTQAQINITEIEKVLRKEFLVFPATLYVSFVVIYALNYNLARLFFRRFRLRLDPFRLRLWQPPFYMVWISAVFLALFLVQDSLLPDLFFLELIVANATRLLVLFYLFYGFVVFSGVLEQAKISPFSKSFFLFTTFFAILWLGKIAIVAIGLFGFFDHWVNFRKHFKPKENEDKN